MHRLSILRRNPRFGPRLVLLAALVGGGCGGGKGSVSGTVTFKDKPLPTGTITFLDDRNEVLASSAIREGKYAVFNLPVGPTKIIVSTPPESPSKRRRPRHLPGVKKSEPLGKGSVTTRPAVMVFAIPARYADPAQTDLTFTVQAGEQEHNVELK